MTRSDLDNRAHERARYLEATTDLKAAVADAVAYSELGYSDAGIADKIDSTPSTVGKYLDRVVAQYGVEAAHVCLPDEFATDRDLSEVDRDQVAEWPQHYRETWQDAVERHPDKTPISSTPDDEVAAETTNDEVVA